ncbi:hypothetical protein [Nocardia yunnanensis]|uniref:hypothetical protein n=1 Tax=Nocardia yunnanensis TaxID=2382165 RepID=UPI0013C4B435|nr:hypothetical protein [Nocardia yunnanensis]
MSRDERQQIQPPRQAKHEREAQANLILEWVCGRLAMSLEPEQDWARLDLVATLAADIVDLKFTTVSRDGVTQARNFPQEVVRAFPDLRNLLYEEALGTWFSLRIEVEPPDSYSGTYNFEVDPLWDPPIPPEVYAKDLDLYPRSANNIPRWLSGKLDPAVELPAVAPGTVEDIVERTKYASLQLRLALPAGWTWAQLQFREIGHHNEAEVLWRDLAGRMHVWTPPQPVNARFSELRAAMRGRPACWYAARFEVQHSGEESFKTFGADEPQWITSPPLDAFYDELRQAARFDYALPDWLSAHRSD